MQSRLTDNEEKCRALESEVDKLRIENVKLNTDVKIIRNEHSEILHSLYTLEKKNSHLQQENQVLKRLVSGERDLKGQETNLPRPYIEPINPADQSFHSSA
jgi:septal ring factor EnvC (AmiA/AmiB activator)